jgi:hypothetical protein
MADPSSSPGADVTDAFPGSRTSPPPGAPAASAPDWAAPSDADLLKGTAGKDAWVSKDANGDFIDGNGVHWHAATDSSGGLTVYTPVGHGLAHDIGTAFDKATASPEGAATAKPSSGAKGLPISIRGQASTPAVQSKPGEGADLSEAFPSAGPEAPIQPAAGQTQSGQPLAPAPVSPALAAARQDAAKAPGAGRALINGALFGFEPDIDAAGQYVAGSVSNALKSLQGKPITDDPLERAKAVDQAEREAAQTYAGQHPIISGAANIAGSLINPLTYMGGAEIAGAKGLAEAGLAAAKTGGALGALQGVGEAGGDIGHRIAGGLEGAAGGAVLGGALGGVGRRVGNTIGSMAERDTTKGTLQAIDALNGEGIDYQRLPKAAKADIQDGIAAGQDPTQTAIAAVAKHQPGSGIRLTQAELEGSPKKMLKEEGFAKGAYGEGASNRVRGFKQGQQEDIATAGAGVKHVVSGGQELERGEAGRKISDTLNAQKRAAKAVIDRNYEAARTGGAGAHLSASHTRGLFDDVRSALHEHTGGTTEINAPRVEKVLDKLEAVMTPEAEKQKALPSAKLPKDFASYPKAVQDAYLAKMGSAPASVGQEGRGATVNQLFAARRALQAIAKNPTHEERAAATVALKRLDEGIDAAITSDLLKGDPSAIAMWRKANHDYKGYAGLFKGNDLVQKLTETEARGGDFHALKVSPEDATNYILGRQGLSALGSQNMARDLTNLRSALGGANAPAWRALKGEIAGRLLETGAKREGISGGDLKNAWRLAKQNYQPILNGLFTADEQQTIQRFVTTASRATTRLKGGFGSSNTAVEHASIAASKLGLTGRVANYVRELAASGAARKATVGAGPRMQKPKGILGALANIPAAAARNAGGALANSGATVTRGVLDTHGGP